MDFYVRLIAILLGLLSCFYGYPLFRFFLILGGLFYGYIYGQAFFAAYHPVVTVLVAVGLAVLLAVLAYPFWSIGVGAVGAALGFIILAELALALNLPHLGIVLVGILGAVILGFGFFQARDLFVMVTTAFNGAVQALYGLGLIHGAISFGFGQGNIMALLGIAILGSLGLAVQYSMFKGRRQYSQ